MYREIIGRIYDALCERGYNPIRQLGDFLLSGDPTHITPYRDARILCGSIDREAFLGELLRSYLGGGAQNM
ncbi:MAG: IreB family regulatory phosphoprotein [Oscillospiraceae bacterium]|nr:IreB family regulatory phosphoprotein [Oscillospiraceae bacterium]